ncbi:MAG: RNA-guided pseudouridylation complex pseudouridine synthase subunit Cbf5 [Candidatus Woesearchaeota archaeon]
MGKLPFERDKRKKLVRHDAATSEKYGCDPEKRPIQELLEYGIVNLDKPSGPTSHQVSSYVQKILKLRKSGHSGTLDPGVTGVLPVALGRGTRIVQSLLIAGKEYVCLMRLHEERSRDQVERVLEEFTGRIRQMPPVKSAVKRQWRWRKVYYNELLDHDGADVLFKVGCQAGTYIRKLCLDAATEILTPQGLVRADAFFNYPRSVFSFAESSDVVRRDPSHLQKIASPGEMVEITGTSGLSFSVTPDHEMLVSTPQGYVMKAAEDMTPEDWLVKSENLFAPEKELCVADFLDDDYLVAQEDIKKVCKEAFILEYGSIRGMYKKLRLDRKSFLSESPYAIPIGHLKKAGVYGTIKHDIHTFKSPKGKLVNCKGFSEDFFYLLGLVASDGNNTVEKRTVRHTRVKFHNMSEALVDLFIRTHKSLFPNISIRKKKLDRGLFEVDTSNGFLATIAANFGVLSPQKKFDFLPVLNAKKTFIAAFLRGYFDGDGTAYFHRKSSQKGFYHDIRLFTVSKTAAKRLHQGLRMCGVPNKIFGKDGACFIVAVESPGAKKFFIDEIGSSHARKRAILKKILSVLPDRQTDDHYAVPFHYKQLLLDKKLGFRLDGNTTRILKSDAPLSRYMYRKLRGKMALPPLDTMVVERVKAVRRIPPTSKAVYDMTVPITHNFLIEDGYVSSNCHDMGSALGCGAHMQELRRTKAGPFKEDSLVTLHDLTDAYAFWKEEGDEQPLREAVRPVERAVSHLPRVAILDTTADALCHGATLKVRGIAWADDEIQPEDHVAVVTLKGELVCVGEAKLASKDMVGKESGVAVKSSQVFMRPGTYPKA